MSEQPVAISINNSTEPSSPPLPEHLVAEEEPVPPSSPRLLDHSSVEGLPNPELPVLNSSEEAPISLSLRRSKNNNIKRGGKRGRAYTPEQYETLWRAFLANPLPRSKDPNEYAIIASEAGLVEGQVRIWFQNTRSRSKTKAKARLTPISDHPLTINHYVRRSSLNVIGNDQMSPSLRVHVHSPLIHPHQALTPLHQSPLIHNPNSLGFSMPPMGYPMVYPFYPMQGMQGMQNMQGIPNMSPNYGQMSPMFSYTDPNGFPMQAIQSPLHPQAPIPQQISPYSNLNNNDTIQHEL
ncbi:hypothetical protein RCL1_002748 [Eukaryota sp. TZLM3-RCL]